MSTRFDILDAERAYENHIAFHKCRAGKCPIRANAFLRWMAIAAKWGIEPDDDERQREQALARIG